MEDLNILQNVVNSMGNGLVVTDKEGAFRIFNPKAEKILGIGAIDTTPEQWSQEYGLYDPNSNKMLNHAQLPLFRALKGEYVDQSKMLLRNNIITSSILLSVTSTPIYNSNKKLEGAIAVFQEVTHTQFTPDTETVINVKMLGLARQAGINQTAADIVDKLGNLICSANLPLNLLTEFFEHNSHEISHDLLNAFDASHGNNKHNIQYLAKYLSWLKLQTLSMNREIASLQTTLLAIKKVINSYRSHSKIINLNIKFNLTDLLNELRVLTECLLNQAGIYVRYEDNYSAEMQSDKFKLLDILLSLVINAKEAILNANNQKNKIMIKLDKSDKPEFDAKISVIDNGIGLQSSELKDIFRFGYSNKTNHAGFGLYNCMNIARQIGCSLEVHSGGLNQGSEFVLYIKSTNSS